MVLVIKTETLSLSANSSGTASFSVPEGKKWEISKLTWSSTGAFKITDIRDTAVGYHYNSNDLPSVTLKNRNTGNIVEFEPKPVCTGATRLVFEVTDTSGAANTVYITLWLDEA